MRIKYQYCIALAFVLWTACHGFFLSGTESAKTTLQQADESRHRDRSQTGHRVYEPWRCLREIETQRRGRSGIQTLFGPGPHAEVRRACKTKAAGTGAVRSAASQLRNISACGRLENHLIKLEQ